MEYHLVYYKNIYLGDFRLTVTTDAESAMFNQWSNNNVTKNKPLFTSFTYLNYNIISIHVLKKNKNTEVKYKNANLGRTLL